MIEERIRERLREHSFDVMKVEWLTLMDEFADIWRALIWDVQDERPIYISIKSKRMISPSPRLVAHTLLINRRKECQYTNMSALSVATRKS